MLIQRSETSIEQKQKKRRPLSDGDVKFNVQRLLEILRDGCHIIDFDRILTCNEAPTGELDIVTCD
jgi:hypothetical protein